MLRLALILRRRVPYLAGLVSIPLIRALFWISRSLDYGISRLR